MTNIQYVLLSIDRYNLFCLATQLVADVIGPNTEFCFGRVLVTPLSRIFITLYIFKVETRVTPSRCANIASTSWPL